MTSLDTDALRGVNELIRRRVLRLERRAAMAPLLEAMGKDLRKLTTQVVPELLSKPEAQIRESTLALEDSLERWPAKVQEARELMDALLTSSKRRSAALDALLEALP